MPDFWQFPPCLWAWGQFFRSIRLALTATSKNRGLKPMDDSKVWAFLGDGECDEPESLGALTLAAREQLNNLIWVVNCNLQRLDGPVRGNGKIIQELEAVFRGAGWNVVKGNLGRRLDPLLDQDADGRLAQRNARGRRWPVPEILGLRWQLHPPRLLRHRSPASRDGRALLGRTTPEDAARRARSRKGLCRLPASHRPPECAHRHPRQDHQGLRAWARPARAKTSPISKKSSTRTRSASSAPASASPSRTTRSQRRLSIAPPTTARKCSTSASGGKSLGGFVPQRQVMAPPLAMPPEALWEEFKKSSGKREFATTMAFVAVMRKLMQDKQIGKLVVPIVPDESRTFGMEPLFRQFGIYSSQGQLYEPVDKDVITYYKEAKDGQILEEGITEAGSMSSFIAAARHTPPTASTPFPSSFTTRCSGCSGSAIWSG